MREKVIREEASWRVNVDEGEGVVNSVRDDVAS